MAENIRHRIDKIESDMRYLRYLQNTSTKPDAVRRPPDMRPCGKPPPIKKTSLSNYIRVSKPAFQPSSWSNRANPATPGSIRCLDFAAHDDSCDPLCQAPCKPPAPYVEPMPPRAPYNDVYARSVPYVPQCVKACANPCSENSRRPAAIYKDPTLSSRKPVVNRRPVPLAYDELPCIPSCQDPCSESRRPAPPPTYSSNPCGPICNDPRSGRRPAQPCEDICGIPPKNKGHAKFERKSHKIAAAGAVRAVAAARADKASYDASHYERRPSDPDELRAADKKMRELENRLRESSEKQSEAEDNQRAAERKLQASEERLRVMEGQLRESEELLAQSEEQLRVMENEMAAMDDKLRACQRENEKLRGSLETSRASSRRNSEAQSMALDLATKIADKYKAASAEKVEAQNQIDDLKAEGEALLKRLQLAERKAAMLEKEAEKPHDDCEEMLNKQSLQTKLLEQALKEMEDRALAAEQAAQQTEDLKAEAAASMMRAAEAEARADEERKRAEEASQRAQQLEEETRLADERANEAENDARDARQRAKDAEQRVDDFGTASDDQQKASGPKGAGAAGADAKKKPPCRCGRSRSRKRPKEEVVPVEHQPSKRHKCCLCCCKKSIQLQQLRQSQPRQAFR